MEKSGAPTKQSPAVRRIAVRRKQQQHWLNALICFACAAVVAGLLVSTTWVYSFELFLGDLATKDRGGGRFDPQLSFVGIDDASLDVLDILDEEEVVAQPALDAMSFGHPFPRSVHAALAQRLLDAGAELIVFDMVFIGETEAAEDAALRRVIDANPGRIVLGCNFVDWENEAGGFINTETLPATSILAPEGSLDPRLGSVNVRPDSDGRMRSVRFATGGHGNILPRNSLTMAALKQLGKEHLVGDPWEKKHLRFPESPVEGSSYAPIPYYSVLFDRSWELNHGGGAAFDGKIVFVGGSSIVKFHDVVSIPSDDRLLGAQFHMHTLSAALNGDFYAVPGMWAHLLSVLLMAAVAFGVAFIMRRPLLGLAILMVGVFGYWLLVRWAYFGVSVLLPSAAPLLTLALAGISCFGTQFAMEKLEKRRLRRTLERQVSKELAEHILSMPEDYYESLPGVRKPVTVLFSDIRSFTSRSEKDDPVELVSQLKEYLDVMGEIVFEHGGVVDKFIGDAVMAVWGNLHSDGAEQDARNAVAAAVAMQQKLAVLNQGWRAAGREPFEIGIGLNYGEAIFGMMGSEQKQEMTVIGDPVNQAARLEGLTKKFGQGIIVGPRVAELAGDEFALRSLGKVRTMGKVEAEELSAVLVAGEDGAAVDWLRRYHEALEAFRRGELERAGEELGACADERPGDPTVAMYLEAIAQGERSGVLVMTGK